MKAKLIGLVTLILSWCSPALANTVTYTYTGADYTTYGAILQGPCCATPFTQADLLAQAQSLGPHMEMSVTFQNVTSAINGTFALAQCVFGCIPVPPAAERPYISAVSISSGVFHGQGGQNASITLADGVVTSWTLGGNFSFFFTSPSECGVVVMSCWIASDPSGDSMLELTYWSGSQFWAHNNTPGVWNSNPAHAPGPIAGAGLPGLVLVGLLGWWCRRRHRQGSVLA